MEVNNGGTVGGSLHIASDVVEKIASLAAMEIEGVAGVSTGNASVKNIMNKIAPVSPVMVDMRDDVAQITVSIVVAYGSKITELSEKVQQNIKTSVQNMTQITVAKVNVVVTGIAPDEEPEDSLPLED